ncbi:MAG: heavy metal translocating P-type ATPase [Helicobacteraceae bacterium]|jgi:heavy metal translocating P-type ATPase|nr:heavy metal translocating P-type ATPase [Helicobacteraceae bacterium]
MSLFASDAKGAIKRAALSLALTPFLPKPLKLAMTLAASFGAIKRGVESIPKEGITGDTMEAAAIVVSLLRGNYASANATNLLIAISRAIERAIVRRSDDLLLSLSVASSGLVWVKRGEDEIRISADEAKAGDIVVAYAGDTIEVDGITLSGLAAVNESAMTGESLAVRKERGSRVLSGTTVEEGRIEIYAEATGSDRAAARIARVVADSLNSRSQTQYRANRLADRLIPFSLGLTGVTALVTRNADRIEALLQTDYSCALRLSVPVVFKAAMYRAGKAGLLAKSAEALEKLAKTTTFIFDKTGTITNGELEVVETISLNKSWSKEQILALAASIEEHYFHPIAQAIVEAARKDGNMRHFQHTAVEFIAANGVFAYVEGKKVAIGSRRYLEENEKIDFSSVSEIAFKAHKSNLTPLYIGFDDALLGVVWLKDEPRKESKEALLTLRALGVKKCVMLTGDSKAKATALAQELGFDECRYELKPDEKAAIAKELRANGETCAFIGDGINDAPALLAADVGIAMQKGADVAKISADITLLKDDIFLLAAAKSIANQTVSRVNQGSAAMIAVNTAILFCAAIGALSPVATGFLHNGSTIATLALSSIKGFKLPAPRAPLEAPLANGADKKPARVRRKTPPASR